MTAIKNMNKAQFNNMLKKYDTNNDGKLDQTDVRNLQAKGAAVSFGKGVLAFLTGGASLIATGIGSDASKHAEQLKGMLARDNNGRIDANDIKQPSSHNAYNPSCRPPANNGSSKKVSTSDLQKKLKEMKAAKANDLKDIKKAWRSDDMARDLVLNHPRYLDNMSLQEKAFVMSTLRDSGSGKHAWIGKQDCKAMLKILASATPEERAIILDMAGGKEAFAKHMKGTDLDQFNKLCGEKSPSKAPSKASNQKAASYQVHQNKYAQVDEHRPQTFAGTSTSSSTSKNSTSDNSQTSAPSKNYESFGEAFDGMRNELREKSRSVHKLMNDLKNCKDPEKKKDIRLKLQMAMQEEKELFSLLTSILKQQHDMAMASIQKM